jgi:hypothetical protein
MGRDVACGAADGGADGPAVTAGAADAAVGADDPAAADGAMVGPDGVGAADDAAAIRADDRAAELAAADAVAPAVGGAVGSEDDAAAALVTGSVGVGVGAVDASGRRRPPCCTTNPKAKIDVAIRMRVAISVARGMSRARAPSVVTRAMVAAPSGAL